MALRESTKTNGHYSTNLGVSSSNCDFVMKNPLSNNNLGPGRRRRIMIPCEVETCDIELVLHSILPLRIIEITRIYFWQKRGY